MASLGIAGLLARPASAQAPQRCATQAPACNLVWNGSFEQNVDGSCPTSSGGFLRGPGDPLPPPPPTPNALICVWTNANRGSCDYFGACDPAGNNSIFAYLNGPAGGPGLPRPARTGNGCGGLYTLAARVNTTPNVLDDYREYMAQPAALQAGRAYYAEAHVALAANSSWTTSTLTFGLAPTSVPYAGTGPIAAYPAANGVRSVLDLPLPTATGTWTRLSGVFTAPPDAASRNRLVIGNFGPALSTGPGAAYTVRTGVANAVTSAAYYFIDDVLLLPMPTAGPDRSALCGQTVTLGEGCALPASAGATYAWSPTTGLSNPNALITTATVGFGAAPQYTLTITLPNGALPPTEYASTTHVYAIPTAGTKLKGECDDKIVLGASCGLPAAPGTQYSWSPTTDLIADQNTANPTLLVGPNTASAYTLTVLTPYTLPNGSTAYTTTTSTVQVQVTGNLTRLAITTNDEPLCAGSTRVLEATGGDGTNYSWSSPQLPGFSATGPLVTVNLVAGNMTFIVTSTTCGAATINLTVKAQCCLIDEYRERRVKIKEINGRYDASTGSPFDRGPGAVYHVTGDVELYDLDYELEPGVKVLVDGFRSISLKENAALHLNGATLTAACNEMWIAVWAWPQSKGIVTYDPSNPSATARSTVEHSIFGLNYWDVSRGAVFEIGHVDFRQNFYSLSFSNGLYYQNSRITGSVRECTFDSDSSAFKAPYQYLSATDYCYSQVHVRIDGDVTSAAIERNTFAHAMYGVQNVSALGSHAFANLQENQFRTCYVSGISCTSGRSLFSPPGSTTITLERNRFYLPSYQPPIPQRLRDIYSGFVAPYFDQCHGAVLLNVRAEAYANTFEQSGVYDPNRFPYDFDNQRMAVDVGLRANLLYEAKDNTFVRLGHGMQLSLAADAPVSVLGNTFRDCQVGLGVSTRSDQQPSHMAPSRSGGPELFSSCNTFDPNPDRQGTSTGIVVDEPGASAPMLAFSNFDGPALGQPNPYPLKDLFLPNGRAFPDFVTIDNRGSNQVEYTTFTLQARDYLSFKVGLVDFPFAGALDNNDPAKQSCTIDGFPDTGIQLRFGGVVSPTAPATVARLEQNVPNPCTGSTTLNYALPAGTRQATILVRRGLDGVMVEQITVKPNAGQQLLDLHRYAPGLYFYTLVADGLPVQTKRMLVE